jgi:hypothetical protein
MIDKSAIEKIEQLAVGARCPVVTVPSEPAHVYYLRQVDGSLARQTAEPHPRVFEFGSLEALIMALVMEQEPGLVFVGQESVHALLGSSRRERFEMALARTQPARKYQDLCEKPLSATPRDLAQFLRLEFPSTPGTIVGLLRSAKFEAHAEDTAKVTVDSASMGQSVRRAAMFGKDLAETFPEEFLVDCPIYGPSASMRAITTHPLRFLMELDLAGKEIVLRGDSDCLEQAVQESLETVAARLREALPAERFKVYVGAAV